MAPYVAEQITDARSGEKHRRLIAILRGVQPHEAADMVRALVDAEGSSGAVHFTGALPHDEIPAALAVADVYVSLNQFGNLSNQFGNLLSQFGDL